MRFAFIELMTTLALVASAKAVADGKDVYTKACAICHASLPPKLGDKAAWAPPHQARDGCDGSRRPERKRGVSRSS